VRSGTELVRSVCMICRKRRPTFSAERRRYVVNMHLKCMSLMHFTKRRRSWERLASVAEVCIHHCAYRISHCDVATNCVSLSILQYSALIPSVSHGHQRLCMLKTLWFTTYRLYTYIPTIYTLYAFFRWCAASINVRVYANTVDPQAIFTHEMLL